MKQVSFVLSCPSCKRHFVRVFDLDPDVSESCMMGMTFMERCDFCGEVDDCSIVSVDDRGDE